MDGQPTGLSLAHPYHNSAAGAAVVPAVAVDVVAPATNGKAAWAGRAATETSVD